MKIYTKTGDKGTSALLGGERVSKAHLRLETYGTVDELNAYMGLLGDQEVNQPFLPEIRHIQDCLFTIGTALATAPGKALKNMPQLTENDVQLLESAIDRMEETLPPLRSFILPGGHQAVSFCHIARTVCRRAERHVVALNEVEQVEEVIIHYLNRLSDYLFVLARKMGKELKAQEVVWKPRNKN